MANSAAHTKPHLDLDVVLYDFKQGVDQSPESALNALNLLMIDDMSCSARIVALLQVVANREGAIVLEGCQETINAICTYGLFPAFEQKKVTPKELTRLTGSPLGLVNLFRSQWPEDIPIPEAIRHVQKQVESFLSANANRDTKPVLQTDTQPWSTTPNATTFPDFSEPLESFWGKGDCHALCQRLRPVLPALLQASRSSASADAVLDHLESACGQGGGSGDSTAECIAASLAAADSTFSGIDWPSILVPTALILLPEICPLSQIEEAVRELALASSLGHPADILRLPPQPESGSMNDWANARSELAYRATELYAQLNLWLSLDGKGE
jgi:hypothetical protein